MRTVFALAPIYLISGLIVVGCATTPKIDNQAEETMAVTETAEVAIVSPKPVEKKKAPSALSGVEMGGDSDAGTAGPMETVFFSFDSATLSVQAQKALQKNAQFLKLNPSVKVRINGHADERGSDQYNDDLGQSRAAAVREQLLSMGVEPKRISVKTFGKKFPMDSAKTQLAYEKNRRANFVITGK